MRIQGGLRGDRFDLDREEFPGSAFHVGVQAAGATQPKDTVSFPVPELVPVFDLGGTVMDRGAPLDPLRMHSSSLSFPAFAVPTGQILPKLTV
ncbi:hypothetical protein ADILRU_1740 [Leifsonia rubra CMS 76R]|nr:hypothetical protein ADILRU_1740 [Leifsonia rubra CMS 76R]